MERVKSLFTLTTCRACAEALADNPPCEIVLPWTSRIVQLRYSCEELLPIIHQMHHYAWSKRYRSANRNLLEISVLWSKVWRNVSGSALISTPLRPLAVKGHSLFHDITSCKC